ncbi:hypothetical protein BJY01DRAFT_210445 [Aspergillus pseudoustus]|uniref:Uncharacterized protein n=1 Tax=Aspergillus pseudoustus TaxID=1810923 RepID=A0ABR4KE54_9EURO
MPTIDCCFKPQRYSLLWTPWLPACEIPCGGRLLSQGRKLLPYNPAHGVARLSPA